MRALIALAIVLCATPVLAAPAQTRSPLSLSCEKAQPRLARTGGGMIVRGGDPAVFDLHVAMLRRVDGCIVPAILRRDVDRGGARPDARRSPREVRPL